NNGGLDLIASTPKEKRVWLRGESEFQLLPVLPPRVTATVDLTHDGRLDLLALADAGQPLRLINHGTRAHHSRTNTPFASKEKLKAKEPTDNRMNSFAIGSEVEVRTGLVIQKQVTRARSSTLAWASAGGPTLSASSGRTASSRPSLSNPATPSLLLNSG